MTGARALLEFLSRSGVDCLFGNPGTTELPILDELAADPGARPFILALQESVAVGMADGYAQATGGLGVLLLHCTGGVANGLGLLYNAARAGTPLLVLAGQQDTRLIAQDPFLYSDMLAWMRPFCKRAEQVAHPRDLARILRRAVQTALTPPTGPVFVALPLDVLQGEVAAPIAGPTAPHGRRSPDPEAVTAAAAVLGACERPALIAGDRVAQAGAEAELRDFAEHAGWPVYLEPYPGRFIFPTDHPLYRGMLPRFPGAVRSVLADHDGVLAIGMPVFEHFLHDGEEALPPGTVLVHADSDPAAVGRNHPTAVGLIGDPGLTLAALRGRLRPSPRPGAAGARPALPPPGEGFTGAHVAHVLSQVLDADDILVEEAISGRGELLSRVARTRPGTAFGEKGGTIGWGFPAALGVSLGRPGARVVAVVGDGSFVMGLQGLWTLARSGSPVCVVVLDNGGYGILRQGLASLGGHAARSETYPATDVDLDLPALVRGFGVAAEVAEDAAALDRAVRRGLASGAPCVVVARVREAVRPLA